MPIVFPYVPLSRPSRYVIENRTTRYIINMDNHEVTCLEQVLLGTPMGTTQHVVTVPHPMPGASKQINFDPQVELVVLLLHTSVKLQFTKHNGAIDVSRPDMVHRITPSHSDLTIVMMGIPSILTSISDQQNTPISPPTNKPLNSQLVRLLGELTLPNRESPPIGTPERHPPRNTKPEE